MLTRVVPANGRSAQTGSKPRSTAFSAPAVPFFVPTITATKTAVLGSAPGDDVNANGKINRGDTLLYTIGITNGGTDATGVNFSDTIDSNTTLVPGSFSASPVATNDTLPVTVVGNVSIDTSAMTTPFSVTANDYLGANPTATISAFDATTTNGGTVSMTTTGANIGKFTYDPPAGFEGTDTFTYTLTDNANASSAASNRTATVSIPVSGMIWFINNNAAACVAAGCGRLSNPFSTLAAFQALNNGAGNNPAANDNIFVYESATAYTGGVTLLSGQKLIGQDASSSLASITLLTPPTGSAALPAMSPGGTASTITNAAGNGVSATDVLPAVIRGLYLSGSSNAVDLTITGAATGTTAITENTIGTTGAEGIDINHGGTNTVTVGVSNNIYDLAGTHGGAGFDARKTSTGSLRLSFNGNANVFTTTGSAVMIDGATGAGVLFITGFGSNSVSGNTVGNGITVATATFDSDPTTTALNQVVGGATAVGASGNGVGTTGMVMSGVKGDLDFTDLDIFADNGAGLDVTGTGAVSLAGGSGFRMVMAAGVGTATAVNGPAVLLTNLTVNLPFQTITSTNSSGVGVSLTGINDGDTASIFAAGSGSSITNATSTDFLCNSNNADVTYSGTITDDVGQLVGFGSNTGGTKIMNGAITDGDDGDGSGVSLTNNTNTTIRFSGGLVLSTGSNPAFAASGGGTVEVCDEDPCNSGATGALINKLTTTTATALNVTSTAIGTNGLEFRSISVNGATKGIILNSTGTAAGNGGLTVNGTGTSGSGGTIQNTSNRGGEFITTKALVLKNMNFTNAGTSDLDADNSGLSIGDNLVTNAAIHLQSVTGANIDNVDITCTTAGCGEQGINGNTVSDFHFDNGSIVNVGNEPDEDNIHFFNMTGTSTITNSVLTHTAGAGDDNLNLQTQAGTLNLTISGGSCNGAAGGALQRGSGYLFGIRGTSNATITLTGVNSNNNFSGGIVADAFDNSSMALTVNGGSISTGNNDQLSVSAGDNSNVDLNANNSTFSSVAAGDFVAISLQGSAFDNGFTFDARVQNNTITTGNNLTADGVFVFNAGGGLMNVLVANNTIDYAGSQQAINIQPGQDGAGTTNATVTGNNIDIKIDGTANAVRALMVQVAVASPSGDGSTLCADIGGAGALSNTVTHSLGGSLGAGGDLRVRQRFVTTVKLPGYGGANNDNAAVVTFLSNRNNFANAPEVSATNEVGVTPGAGGFVNTPGGAPCTQPSPFPNPGRSGANLPGAPSVNLGSPTLPFWGNYEKSESVSRQSFWWGSLSAQTRSLSASTTNAGDPVSAVIAGPGVAVESDASKSKPSASLLASVWPALESVLTEISPTVSAQRVNLNPVASSDDVKRPESGETVSAAIGNLPAGKSVTIVFKATLSLSPGYNSVSNQGTVTATGGISVLTDDPGVPGANNPTVTPLSAPDLTAVKTNNVSGKTKINTAWNWTIAVTNGGTEDAVFTNGQVMFSDNLPDTNITYGAPTTNNANVVCAIDGSLNLTCMASGTATLAGPGGTFNITVPVTGASAAGAYVNPRSGGGCTVDPSLLIDEGANEGNNTCTNTVNVFTPPTVVKSFLPTSVAPGGTSTLSIQIINPAANPAALTGVGFTDTFPAGLQVAATPMSTNSCGGTFTPAAGNTSITLGTSTLNAGSTCTVTVKVTPTTGGAKVNSVTVASTEGGNATVATATLTVGKAPLDFDGDGTTDYAVIRDSGLPVPPPGDKNGGSDTGTSDPVGGNTGADESDGLLGGNRPIRVGPLVTPQWGLYFKAPGERFNALEPQFERSQQIEANQLRWLINTSGPGADLNILFGTLNDFPVPADYDGDGICDLAVWTGGVGAQFKVLTSSSGFVTTVTYTLGNGTSDPSVVGDYDGDGKADPAIMNANTGQFTYLGGATHATTVTVTPVGAFGGGFPIPGDYDGDGKYDFMLETRDGVNPTMGHYYLWNNTGSTTPAATTNFAFGNYRDVVMPGDYDGDGKTDLGVASLIVNPAAWRIRLTNGGTLLGPFTLGNPTVDYTLTGDYNGDQKAEITIFHPPATTQFQSLLAPNYLTPTTNANWGQSGDYPLAYFNSH